MVQVNRDEYNREDIDQALLAELKKAEQGGTVSAEEARKQLGIAR
ncbi:hypothetical protein [Levilactobacillus yiduensis]|nr:hypothetical protein [Levilactobacillus yiduensis]